MFGGGGPRAVLQGDDPSSGVRLASHSARKIPGFDLTFRAPMSRGRHTNRLYVHAATGDPHGIHHHLQPEPDPHTRTIAGLRRSATQTPAVAFLDDDEVIRVEVQRRGEVRELDYTLSRRSQHRQLEWQLQDRLQRERVDIDRLTQRRQELGGLSRLRRAARNEIADNDLQLHGHRWSLAEARRRLDATKQVLASLPDDAELARRQAKIDRLDRKIAAFADIATRNALVDPPDYLLTTIGRAPDNPGPERARWIDTQPHEWVVPRGSV